MNTSVDWASVPVFGIPENRYPFSVRPSAYGVVVNEHGFIAVVRTATGLHLPGGGSDAGETPAATVRAVPTVVMVLGLTLWRARKLIAGSITRSAPFFR